MECDWVIGYGLGWVVDPKFVLCDGMGWVEEIGPTDNSDLSYHNCTLNLYLRAKASLIYPTSDGHKSTGGNATITD